jgi:filamentous hemagglutinin family protein
MKLSLSALFGLSISTLGSLFISGDAIAQVTSDGTVNTEVNQSGNVSEITGGETRGGNLFHSFQEFSVQTGNEAFFDNAETISNIFSRVTGGNISNIDGLIRANGGASLFLINPAGIVFGENASLDIGGSFYGSSADSILFEDGEFSATDLDNPPLLTINAPIGLSLRDDPGDIVNNAVANDGRGLEVSTGNNISLLGGNVIFNGGRTTAPGGIINLGGLSSAGEINIDANNNLSFPDEVAKSNVSLSNNAVIDVTSGGGGLIAVNASTLELTGESFFRANIGEGLGSEDAVAGTIDINATSIVGEEQSLINSDNLGIGRAGTINITTDTLNLNSGSAITATTYGVGDAGTINVTARDIALNFEFTGIYSNVGLTNVASESLETNVEGVEGNGGVININTDTLSLTNGARIISSSIAQGDGGTVNITATGAVEYIGQGETPVDAFNGGPVISGSFSQVQQDTGNGNSGNVNITADSLTLIDKGAVLTDNSGDGGDAGDINLNIQNEISLDQNALILSQIQRGATGNGGDINIQTSSLESRGGSIISADTIGTGDAGNINIQADNSIVLDSGSGILTKTLEDGIGDAGDINITANSLNVENGAEITTETQGEGNAGNITISTIKTISLINAGIFSRVTEKGIGNGGDISLTTGQLNLTNYSNIIADTNGQGASPDNISSAGDINIDVTGDINLNSGNQIQSQSLGEAVGNAGNITIKVGGSLFSAGGNLILADSKANGDGGNITITAGEQIVLEGFQQKGFPSQIVVGLTEDAKGKGGNIAISASELILRDVAFITANNTSTSEGAAGNVTINVDRLQLTENAFINGTTNNGFEAGEVTINARTIDLLSGGKIAVGTSGGGNAGNINLNVSDRISIDNSVESSARFIDFGAESTLQNELQGEPSGIFANATENATGNGGSIAIGKEQAPENLIISNNGQIIVNSEGDGNGGNIYIRSDSIDLDNNATISASTANGTGGGVNLEIADSIKLRNNSSISAEALNNADGGNINIDTNFIVAFPDGNNDIRANAQDGKGGNIEITAESLFGIEARSLNDSTNDINASSEASLDGTVSITTPEVDAIRGATQLPDKVVEAEQTTDEVCAANSDTGEPNGLTVKGRGGLPATPFEPLESENITVDGVTVAANDPEIKPIPTDHGDIYPARGIIFKENGDFILTAYPTDNVATRTPTPKKNCNDLNPVSQ